MFAIGGLQSMLEYDRGEPAVRGRASLRNPLRLLVSPEPWLAFLFMLLNLVFGVLWFSLFVTLISTGVGLVITLIGLPILAGTLMLWTYAARFERRRTNAMLGVRIDDPYRPLPEGPAIERLRAHVRDPYVWLDLLYLILLFPIGIIEFVIATVFVSLPIGMITLPAYFQTGDYFVIGNYNVNTWPVAIAVSVLGVLLLLVVPYIFVGIGRGHARLAQALLGANREAALKARVGQLSESRSRALDAAITDLQRIERDSARRSSAAPGEAGDGSGHGQREDENRPGRRRGTDHRSARRSKARHGRDPRSRAWYPASRTDQIAGSTLPSQRSPAVRRFR